MRTTTTEGNKVKQAYLTNLSIIISELDKESFFNSPLGNKKVIDEIKNFDNQFINKETQKLINNYLPNKDYKPLKLEAYYLNDLKELKIKSYNIVEKITAPILAVLDLDLFYSNLKLKNTYFTIENQEDRFELIFNEFKKEIENSFSFLFRISLENKGLFSALISGKIPSELIDDKSIESYFNSALKCNSLDNIINCILSMSSLSHNEKKRFRFIYDKVLNETN